MSKAEELTERAELLSWPMVVAGGSPITSEGQWRRACALPGLHATLENQLAELEAKFDQDARRAERWAEEDARRAKLAEPDEEAAAEERATAEAIFEKFERERPRRVEEKLDEIASSLRTIAEGLARR